MTLAIPDEASGSPLLGPASTVIEEHPREDAASPDSIDTIVPQALSRRLFVSHFLSTWNSRVFEFGAVLYLAAIFPGTLLPLSVYALARGSAAIILSPVVGRYIDTANRLHVVRLSIVLQRLAVAASCGLFWLLVVGWKWISEYKVGVLCALALLSCVEKLCAIMNLVSVERDWVIVIAGEDEVALRALNSQMRRIDLFCKLAGPFFISMIDGISTKIAILVNLGMNLASITVEYYAIARVYGSLPALQQPKVPPQSEPSSEGEISSYIRKHLLALRNYFRHRSFLPSFAGSLLYFTVLNFGGQMITYLLSIGYNATQIGVVRCISVAFEMSATWIAPRVMSGIGPIRAGVWFVNWQLTCLVVGATVFWVVKTPILSASALVGATILSRVGLWGFDLSTQVIIQEEVEPGNRGSFSSVEASWQNAFEICAYITTIVFSRPRQFKWPVLMSCIAVFLSGALYTLFVRLRRGHLFHFSKCMEPRSRRRSFPGVGYERLSQSSATDV